MCIEVQGVTDEEGLGVCIGAGVGLAVALLLGLSSKPSLSGAGKAVQAVKATARPATATVPRNIRIPWGGTLMTDTVELASPAFGVLAERLIRVPYLRRLIASRDAHLLRPSTDTECANRLDGDPKRFGTGNR